MSKIRLKGIDGVSISKDVTIHTENGIARGVIVGGYELPHVMSVNIRYGICIKPIVTVAFMANSVTIEEMGDGEK